MTPCEKMGYKVGDKFIVTEITDIRGYGFAIGSKLCLLNDDGSSSPLFRLIEGSHSDGLRKAYKNLSGIKPLMQSELSPSFPDHPFKLRNGDKPEVRQWLKDNGVIWCDGDDVVEVISSDYNSEDGEFLTIYNGFLETCSSEYCFDKFSAKEIRLNIQPAKVVGYSLVEKVEQKFEKELQLEEIVAKLQSQLNEAQTELNNLK